MRKRVSIFALATAIVMGSIAGGNVASAVKAEETLIEEDIPVLRDSFDENFGGKTYAGVSLTNDEIDDPNIMALVTKHFNAVTFGNELKPDAIFGYSNSKAPQLITYDFNGEEFEAPKMDFSRADKMLDYFVDWNANNPDKQIKIRGHVLVWHSQTPEWFFHENWDKKQPYVSKAEMTKRQEWYIKEVLEHCTTGKYEGMFYGFDVVNEAISDATGSYRTDEEAGGSLNDDTHGSKSSWWKVYQSNEYIINAFRFANKYAPEDVELYYNDYNECTPLKCAGIIKLMTDVKAAEGTRLDGFGMQGHYDALTPTGGQVKVAAVRYAEVVDTISITELDVKPSDGFLGSEEDMKKELSRQYWKYKEIYQGLKELDEEGTTVRTVTVWGVIDGHSWLNSQNNVGGSYNGQSRVMPLLFNDDYQAKPLFYALCNEPMPAIEKYLPSYKKQAAAEAKTTDAENDSEAAGDDSAIASDGSEVAGDASGANGDGAANGAEGANGSDSVQNSGGNVLTWIIVPVAVVAAAVAALVVKKKKKKDQ